jgi:Uri superfamily endonuclease
MVLKGSYCLCIVIKNDVTLNIGALGMKNFSKGRYIYIGSAMKGIEARVRRHLNTSHGVYNAIHWHIDYLLKEPNVNIEAIYKRTSEERDECTIASAVSKNGWSVKGFGCSDCRCISHLFKVLSCNFLSELGLERHSSSDFHGMCRGQTH